jgi:hypothetical protein
VLVIANLNATLQVFLPGWVRARGLAAYQIVVFGSQAGGALVWGFLAEWTGLIAVFLIAAGALLAAVATIRVWPLYDVRGVNREATVVWPEPSLGFEPDPDTGPILVTTTYTVSPDRQERFSRQPSDSGFPGSGPAPSGGSCTRTGLSRPASWRSTPCPPGRSTCDSTTAG